MALGHVEDRPMSRKRHRPEEIVAKLRQVEVLTAQGQSVAEAIRSIGVTEVSSGTSCSTARSSPRSRKPRSSSRAGAGTTTRSGRTRRWATSRLHRKFSYGRPRYPGQLRRPPRPWRSDPSCTNSQPGPPNGGQPTALFRMVLNSRPKPRAARHGIALSLIVTLPADATRAGAGPLARRAPPPVRRSGPRRPSIPRRAPAPLPFAPARL
jgi:hypothetical protein